MRNLLWALFIIGGLPLWAQPANDNCSSPTALGTLGNPANCGNGIKKGATTTQAGTNVNATSGNPYYPGCNNSNAVNDVWYSFVAPANGYGINIHISGGTLSTPSVALYQLFTNCDSLQGLSCNTGINDTVSLSVSSGIIPGQTYYIQVSGNDATTMGTFNLAVYAFQDCSDCLIGSTLTVSPLPVNGVYQPGQTVSFCYHIDKWTQTQNNWLHGVQMSFGPGWNLASLTTTAPPDYMSTAAYYGGGTPATCGSWAYYPSGITSAANNNSWPAGFYYNGTYTTSLITGLPNGCTSQNDGDPGNNFGDGIANSGLVVNVPANEWNFCWTIAVEQGCHPGVSLSVQVTTSGDGESGNWTSPGCANDPKTNFTALTSCCPPDMASTATCPGLSGGSVTASPIGNAGPYTFTWSAGGVNDSVETGMAAGNYSVTVVDANLCSTSATVSVATNASPVSNAGSAVNFCSGSNATIGAAGTAGNTYSWSPVTGLSSSISPNPTVTLTNTTGNPNTTAYTVTTTTTATGCTSIATVNVTVNPMPAPAAANTGPYCVASTIQLNSLGGSSYAWSGPGGYSSNLQNPTIPNGTLAMSGNYVVTVTANGGCTATASTAVVVASNLTPVVTNAGPYCAGSTVQLNVSGGTTFSWSGPNGYTSAAQNPSIAVATPALSGTYSVTASDASGCTGTGSTNVVVNALPTAAASNTGPYCEGASIQLGALGGSTYAWSGPSAYTSTAQAPVIANAVTGMGGAYNVTATDANGCTATATTTVVISPAPVASAGPGVVVTCSDPQPTLNAAAIPPGDNYNWGGPGIASGGTTATPAVDAAGTYTLTVTDANNCSASASVAVTSTVTPPNLSLGAAGTLTCLVTSVTLNATSTLNTATFAWSNGPSSASVTVTAPGTYTVTATDPSTGCTASASDVVPVDTTAPNVNAGPDQLIGCHNSINLAGSSSTPNVAFSWSGGTITGGATTATPAVTTTGTYTLTVTDPVNGCTTTASTNVNPTNPPVITGSVVNNPCPGVAEGQVTLLVTSGSPPYSYVWNTGASSPVISALQAGLYQVTVTDALACIDTASFTVANGTFIVLAEQNETINLGQSTQLTGVVTGGSGQQTYNWSPSDFLSCVDCQSPVASPYETLSYTLQATDTNGCTGYSTVTITVNPLHNLFIPNAFTPNGNGTNDYFSIHGDLNLIIFFEAKIFDRWGELVFSSNSQYFEWDGTYKGKAEPAQVFVYEMKATFLDRYTTKLYKGSISLIR